MKKHSRTEPVIDIEWSGAPMVDGADSEIPFLAQEELIEIARALGRLAAKRDRARMAAQTSSDRLSSDAINAKMRAKAPV